MEQATGHGTKYVPMRDPHADFPSFDKDCAGHERVLFTGVCIPPRLCEGVFKRLPCRKGTRVKSHDIVTCIGDGVSSGILVGPDNGGSHLDRNKVGVKGALLNPDRNSHS